MLGVTRPASWDETVQEGATKNGAKRFAQFVDTATAQNGWPASHVTSSSSVDVGRTPTLTPSLALEAWQHSAPRLDRGRLAASQLCDACRAVPQASDVARAAPQPSDGGRAASQPSYVARAAPKPSYVGGVHACGSRFQTGRREQALVAGPTGSSLRIGPDCVAWTVGRCGRAPRVSSACLRAVWSPWVSFRRVPGLLQSGPGWGLGARTPSDGRWQWAWRGEAPPSFGTHADVLSRPLLFHPRAPCANPPSVTLPAHPNRSHDACQGRRGHATAPFTMAPHWSPGHPALSALRALDHNGARYSATAPAPGPVAV